MRKKRGRSFEQQAAAPCLFTADTGECYLTFQEKNLQNYILNKQVEAEHMETCQDNSHKHFRKIFGN